MRDGAENLEGKWGGSKCAEGPLQGLEVAHVIGGMQIGGHGWWPKVRVDGGEASHEGAFLGVSSSSLPSHVYHVFLSSTSISNHPTASP